MDLNRWCSKDTLASFFGKFVICGYRSAQSTVGQSDRLKTEKIEIQQTVKFNKLRKFNKLLNFIRKKELQQVQETVKSSYRYTLKTLRRIFPDGTILFRETPGLLHPSKAE